MRNSTPGATGVWSEDTESVTVTTLHNRFNIGGSHATLHYMALDVASLSTQTPLCELHLHLEGSVDPATLRLLDPGLTPEQAAAPYCFTDFAGFIECFKFISLRLRTPADYALVTRRLISSLARQGVAYAEITLSAGVVLWKGHEIGPFYDAVRAASISEQIEVRWILDAIRHFGPDPAWRVVEFAAQRLDDGIAAVGIGGDESRGPADWFRDVYGFARSRGLHLVAHAGETEGPQSIWAALEIGAERIGHGVRAVEDPVLMRYLSDHRIPLEVCLTSNVSTAVVTSMKSHPLRRLYDAGIPVTLNTDDPGLFGCTLGAEFQAAQELGLGNAELRQIVCNAASVRFR